jgi:hypothetical protein
MLYAFLRVMGAILTAFYFAWGVAGGIWVFPLSNDNTTQFENSQLDTYCDPILYWISFSIIIVKGCVLITMGIDASAYSSI